MSSSRAESQASQYGRRRSNTAQSLYRVPPLLTTAPLKYGDAKTLTIWVHDPAQPPGLDVVLNHAHWPGVAEGDMLADETSGFLFSVQKDEASARQQVCPLYTFYSTGLSFAISYPSLGLSQKSSASGIMERSL